MNVFLRMMMTRLLHADPDLAGASGAEAAADEPQDMDATIGALFDKMEAGDPAGGQDADAPAVDQATDKPAPARGPGGRFAPKATDSTQAAAGSKDPATAVATQKPEDAAAATPATQFADAPKSWNATERAAWATIPEAARAAAHRREEDFHRGIEQYRGKAAHFDALHAVIAPHAEVFKVAGQNAVENVSGLLNLQQVLYTGDDNAKVATLLQIASNVGIKPEVLMAGLQNPPQQPAQDPRYDSLARETQQLRQMLGQVQTQPVLAQVEAFFADTKNEFASEPSIQKRMLVEIQNGAKDLKEAYDNACWADRNVRAKIQQKTAEADRKAQAERDAVEAKRKADLAANAKRAASINVKPTGVTAGPAAKGTMDDTIASLYDRMHGSSN